MHGNKPDLVALTLDPKMHHALTTLHVLDPQPAQLLAADAVIEQGGQDGAIAHALERVRRRRLQQLARLSVAERRRAAFIAIRHWPLHAVHGIAGDGVALAEIIEQRGQRRELAPDAGRRQSAGLQVLAPGDDVSSGDRAQLRGLPSPAKAENSLTSIL